MEDDLQLMQSFFNFISREKHISDSTIETYQYYLVMLADFLEENNSDFIFCDYSLLNNFTGAWAHQKGITRASRKPMVAAVKGLFRWLKLNDYRNGNPALDLRYPKAGRPLPVAMSLDNLEKLFAVIDYSTLKGLRDAALLALMADSGMRLSGLASLNESSLIRYAIDGGQGVSVRVLEKGNKERLIPLTDYSIVYLSAYLANKELMNIDRVLEDGDKVLFCSINNRSIPAHEYFGEKRRMSKRAIQNMMTVYAKKAGVPLNESHPHSLRHRYATEMAEEGVDLLTIKDLMGHSDVRTTQIYIHLARTRLHSAVQKGSPMKKIITPLSGVVDKIK